MVHGILKVFIEPVCRDFRKFSIRLKHIKGVHVRVVDIQFCFYTCCSQIFYIS